VTLSGTTFDAEGALEAASLSNYYTHIQSCKHADKLIKAEIAVLTKLPPSAQAILDNSRQLAGNALAADDGQNYEVIN